MSANTVSVEFEKMERFIVDTFIGLGVPEADARICADVLISADKSGIFSHGVNRLKPIYYDRIRQGVQKPVTEIEIVRRGPTTAVIDGHDGMGMVIGKRSMEIAIENAEKYGMGMTVVRNSTHYGIAGYYARIACGRDMIGITGTNARPSVAPTFSTENMLGTNPLTFGIPTDEEFPFVLDCATSIGQRGKIEAYEKLGKEVPAGWVIGSDGEAWTDPARILNGLKEGDCALVPLGGIGEEGAGYKGYGYSTVVEILSSALQAGCFLKMLSGSTGGEPSPARLGHFFIAIEVSAFIDPVEFKRSTGDILRQLRGAKKQPGKGRIYTAGEKEYIARTRDGDRGVSINPRLQQDILCIQDELGLDGYDFPF